MTPRDKVYVLGDVCMKINSVTQTFLRNLPGQKRLVRGNHDLAKDSWYHGAGFSRIYGVRQINGVWLTHVPMHPQTLAGRAIGNIHGHLHANFVMRIASWQTPEPDPRYWNACVEPMKYVPRTIDSIVEERQWRGMN